jgi:hypothetical protein
LPESQSFSRWLDAKLRREHLTAALESTHGESPIPVCQMSADEQLMVVLTKIVDRDQRLGSLGCSTSTPELQSTLCTNFERTDSQPGKI